MSLFHIKVPSIIHKIVELYGLCCHKCNHKAIMKHAGVKNKLFQNSSILICYGGLDNKNSSDREGGGV